MMDKESDSNSELKQISSQALPDLSMPLLGPKLEWHNANLRRIEAQRELDLKRIFSVKEHSQSLGLAEDLWNDKQELQKLFLNSDSAIKENNASISRFYEIVKEQRQCKGKVMHDIAATARDIDDYKEVKETMEKYVQEYSIFEQFAEDVVAVSNDGYFLSVGEILTRYETLEKTRMDIAKILENEMKVQAELRKEMLEILSKKSAALKNLSNRLVMMQVTRKQAQDHRAYWDNGVQRIKNKIQTKEEERVVLQGACWDLYRQVCHRRKVHPTLPRDNMNAQLDFIMKSITFYKEVLTIAVGVRTGGGKKKRSKTLW